MICLIIILVAMAFAIWSNQKGKHKSNPGGRSWERW